MSALLNSLSVGFKTLKRVPTILAKSSANVKTEFGLVVFVKAQKHLQHATGNIDEFVKPTYSAIGAVLSDILNCQKV